MPVNTNIFLFFSFKNSSSSGASVVDKAIVVDLVKEAAGSGSTAISLDAG